MLLHPRIPAPPLKVPSAGPRTTPCALLAAEAASGSAAAEPLTVCAPSRPFPVGCPAGEEEEKCVAPNSTRDSADPPPVNATHGRARECS